MRLVHFESGNSRPRSPFGIAKRILKDRAFRLAAAILFASLAGGTFIAPFALGTAASLVVPFLVTGVVFASASALAAFLASQVR